MIRRLKWRQRTYIAKLRDWPFTIARANSHASCTPRETCSQIGSSPWRHQHDPQLGRQSRCRGGGRNGMIRELAQREGKLRDKTAQRSHTRSNDPRRTHPAASSPKREPHTRRTRTWRGQPTLEQQAGGALAALLGAAPWGAPRVDLPARDLGRGWPQRVLGCAPARRGAIGRLRRRHGGSAARRRQQRPTGSTGAAAGPGEGPA
eukprot:COSAG04_NODE_464_length_13939_cov_11.061922_3_plen_205_part_00